MSDQHKMQWRLEYERMARALADIADRAEELVSEDMQPVKGNHVLGLQAIAQHAIKDLSFRRDFVWQQNPERVPIPGGE